MNLRCSPTLFVTTVVVAWTSASARELPLVATIVPEVSFPVYSFAWEMEVDGNRMIVSAGGGAVIYERTDATGRNWEQAAELNSNAWGPVSVALRGDVAVLGAVMDIPSRASAGAAFLWRRSAMNGQYQKLQTVWPADAEAFDNFGTAAALGDGVAFISANSDTFNGVRSSGSIALYRERLDETGKYDEVRKFAPSDMHIAGGFGSPMALDGDVLVVGGGGGPSEAAAYIFERHAGPAGWGETGQIRNAPNGYVGDVAVSRDSVLVATQGGYGGVGAADLYERDPVDGKWTLSHTFHDPLSRPGGGFGESVAVGSDLVVVTARIAMDQVLSQAFVYQRNAGGIGKWGLVATLSPPDVGPDAPNFGWSVAIMDHLVLVGTLGLSTPNVGSVRVYSVSEPSGGLLTLSLGVVVAASARRKRSVD